MMYGYGNMISATNRLFSGGGGTSPNFLMTIDTTQSGSASNTFILPCGSGGTYNAVVDWGDGTTSNITTYNDADLTHVYSVGGTYQISISGDLPRIFFNNTGDRQKLISIDNWGINKWLDFSASFKGCLNMDILATDTPDFSLCTSLGEAFMSCSSITNVDFSNCDFSNCSSFYTSFARGCFNGCNSLNTVNFTNSSLRSAGVSMAFMFANCGSFDLIGFDTLDLNYVNDFYSFLSSSSITTEQYDSLLIHMANLDMINSLSFNGGTSQYTLGGIAATSRADLISTDLWTITDGGGI